MEADAHNITVMYRTREYEVKYGIEREDRYE